MSAFKRKPPRDCAIVGHCWHVTREFFATNPPWRKAACCFCGALQDANNEHGPRMDGTTGAITDERSEVIACWPGGVVVPPPKRSFFTADDVQALRRIAEVKTSDPDYAGEEFDALTVEEQGRLRDIANKLAVFIIPERE